MSKQCFSLKLFPFIDSLPELKITGNIARSANTLAIRYSLIGPVSEIVIPAPTDVPSRMNNLWEETCFEIFIGVKNSDQYREFNLSPSGHWNVYRFREYREEMKEERAFTSLPFRVMKNGNSLDIELKVNLDRIIPEDQSIEVGVSAVIKLLDGKTTYWALTHPGPQPDFHRRDSFIIEL
jgi:hypothetical protein